MSRTPTTRIRSVAVIDGERRRPLFEQPGATGPRPVRGRGLRLAWIG